MHDQTTSVSFHSSPRCTQVSWVLLEYDLLMHFVYWKPSRRPCKLDRWPIINTYCDSALFAIQNHRTCIIFSTRDRAELHFEGCFYSLFVVFFPGWKNRWRRGPWLRSLIDNHSKYEFFIKFYKWCFHRIKGKFSKYCRILSSKMSPTLCVSYHYQESVFVCLFVCINLNVH